MSLGDALGGQRLKKRESGLSVSVCVCGRERRVVFISSGVGQEELSDVEGEAKKELSSNRGRK